MSISTREARTDLAWLYELRPIGWDPERHPERAAALRRRREAEAAGLSPWPTYSPPRQLSGKHKPMVPPDQLHKLIRVIIDGIVGRRPISQLAGVADDSTLGSVIETRAQLSAVEAHRRARSVHLKSLRQSQLSVAAVEVAAHLSIDRRSAAMAFQLRRGTNTPWVCTAVELRLADLIIGHSARAAA